MQAPRPRPTPTDPVANAAADPTNGDPTHGDPTHGSAARPLAVLAAGVDSYTPFQRDDGELVDPLIGAPTQYGTAHHGWAHVVLAAYGDVERRRHHASAGVAATVAALRELADPAAPARWSSFDRTTGAATGGINHTDFTWPAVLRSLDLLDSQDGVDVAGLWDSVARVDVPGRFRSRPPSNWAMVWLVGEWRRIQRGLSPYDQDDVDDWLAPFLDTAFVPELGLFVEKGIPNAYDLFTRTHLTELVLLGYDGRHADRVRSILLAGVDRSLAMQLSDGSVASGYRSAGQTWTLGAQVALFAQSHRLGLGHPDAVAAACWLAFDELGRWQRPGGPFSPVQNLHPPHRRIGYEGYTADGHYANLALGFLALGIHVGLPAPPTATVDRTGVRAELEPTHRAVAHRGRVSVAVQSAADGTYDGTGIVDVTFGPQARLAVVSSTRHLDGPAWFNPGLAVRSGPGRTPTAVIAAQHHDPCPGFPRATAAGGIVSESKLSSPSGSLGDGLLADGTCYRLLVTPTADGIDVVESLSEPIEHPVLFLPHLRDLGTGVRTTVEATRTGVIIHWSEPGVRESLELVTDHPIAGVVDLDHGYENRRGSCGLVRIDLVGPADEVRWALRHTREQPPS